MSTETQVRSFAQNFWWLTLLRGIIAVGLGVALLFNPDNTVRSMAQFMGLYWLTSGVSGIIWGFNEAERPILWFLLGIAEVSVGIMLLFRGWLDTYMAWVTVTRLAAVLAFGTGLLHVYAGIHTKRNYGRKWSWGNFFMGLLQITLGLMFIITPNEINLIVLFSATVWAFIGGIGLIMNGLRLRQAVQRGDN